MSFGKRIARLGAVGIAAAAMVLAPTAAQGAVSDRGPAVIHKPLASPNITCHYTGGNTTCNISVGGGYCGGSRPVGVGITTKRKGGITVTSPWIQTLTWNATSTAKSHKIEVGGTYLASVTLAGQAPERPYATCSL